MPQQTVRPQYQCDNCNYTAPEDRFPYAKDLSIRLSPGSLYTNRECPKQHCGALAYPVPDPQRQRRPPDQSRTSLTQDTVKAALSHALAAMQDDPELEEVDTLSLMEEAIHDAYTFLTGTHHPTHTSKNITG